MLNWETGEWQSSADSYFGEPAGRCALPSSIDTKAVVERLSNSPSLSVGLSAVVADARSAAANTPASLFDRREWAAMADAYEAVRLAVMARGGR